MSHDEHDGSEAELRRQVRATRRLPVGVCADDALSAVACTMFLKLDEPSQSEAWPLLPRGLRGMLRPCVLHDGDCAGDRRGFVERVAEHLDASRREAEDAVRAVFAAVRRRLAPGDVARVARTLPPDVASLWG